MSISFKKILDKYGSYFDKEEQMEIKPEYIDEKWLEAHDCCEIDGFKRQFGKKCACGSSSCSKRYLPPDKGVHIRKVVEWLKKEGTHEQLKWMYEKWLGESKLPLFKNVPYICDVWLEKIDELYPQVKPTVAKPLDFHLRCGQCGATSSVEEAAKWSSTAICPQCEDLNKALLESYYDYVKRCEDGRGTSSTSGCAVCRHQKALGQELQCAGCPLDDGGACCEEWLEDSLPGSPYPTNTRDRLKRECEKRGLLKGKTITIKIPGLENSGAWEKAVQTTIDRASAKLQQELSIHPRHLTVKDLHGLLEDAERREKKPWGWLRGDGEDWPARFTRIGCDNCGDSQARKMQAKKSCFPPCGIWPKTPVISPDTGKCLSFKEKKPPIVCSNCDQTFEAIEVYLSENGWTKTRGMASEPQPWQYLCPDCQPKPWDSGWWTYRFEVLGCNTCKHHEKRMVGEWAGNLILGKSYDVGPYGRCAKCKSRSGELKDGRCKYWDGKRIELSLGFAVRAYKPDAVEFTPCLTMDDLPALIEALQEFVAPENKDD